MDQELYFPLGLLLLVIGYLLFAGVSLKQKDRILLYLRAAVFAGFCGSLVYLIRTDRAAMAYGVAVMIIPLAMKLSRLRQKTKFRRTAAAFTKQTQELKTDYIIVRVNQYTKAVNGEIIGGRFAGARLETLTIDDLVSLLQDYRTLDMRSFGVLRSYLDRTQPPDWRERAERKRAEADAPPQMRKPVLSKDEALALLGLKEDATPEDIKAAHRAIMMKVHPDQGGTDYLAAMVNQAKEVLVGQV